MTHIQNAWDWRARGRGGAQKGRRAEGAARGGSGAFVRHAAHSAAFAPQTRACSQLWPTLRRAPRMWTKPNLTRRLCRFCGTWPIACASIPSGPPAPRALLGKAPSSKLGSLSGSPCGDACGESWGSCRGAGRARLWRPRFTLSGFGRHVLRQPPLSSPWPADSGSPGPPASQVNGEEPRRGGWSTWPGRLAWEWERPGAVCVRRCPRHQGLEPRRWSSEK